MPIVFRVILRKAAGLCLLCVLLSDARLGQAIDTHWRHAISGTWTTAGDWTMGVPDSDDDAVFDQVGPLPYTITFPGRLPGIGPPINYVNDRLFVSANTRLTLRYAGNSFATYTILGASSGTFPSIMIGFVPGDVAVLNTSLSVNGVIASVGAASNAQGTLNINAGTFTLSDDLIVGDSGGKGTVNLTGLLEYPGLRRASGVGAFGGIQGDRHGQRRHIQLDQRRQYPSWIRRHRRAEHS